MKVVDGPWLPEEDGGPWKNSESFGLAEPEALLVVAAQAKVWITERSAS